MLTYLITGIVFGLSSGIAPGPMLTLTISETMEHGFEAGLKVACAPLITDSLIITITWFFLQSMNNLGGFYVGMSLVGACVLFWFAWECFSVKPPDVAVASVTARPLQKGVMANLVNPAPYLFWVSVGTPTLLEAGGKGFPYAMTYLGGFFVCLVLSKALIAFITARISNFLRGRFYLGVMRLMGLALAFFGIVFLRKAWTFWVALS